ncbi:CAAX amino protease [Tepiditoga spiralis]|uniref:CAAX amino protease n=1 Tax=Tepiditoga spiralis TaxID=2108365 RepID=A0A7G1GA40_9BACT|nr:type II CAAX endopeptidase family protein [Tepiditoga spiralis]BBE31917.1 CAAX amino protease [Tepiditoga spiralis]
MNVRKFENIKAREFLSMYIVTTGLNHLYFYRKSLKEEIFFLIISQMLILMWFLYKIKKNKIYIKNFFKTNGKKYKKKDTIKFVTATSFIWIVYLTVFMLIALMYIMITGNDIHFPNDIHFTNKVEPNILNSGLLNLIYTIAQSLIISPILEEFIFRGIMINRFSLKWNVKKAVIISSIIFGLIHVNKINIITATIYGLIIGIVYVNTKSLKLPMLIHFFVNFITLIIDFIPDDTSIEDITIFKSDIIFILLIVVPISIYILKTIIKFLKNNSLSKVKNVPLEMEEFDYELNQ